MSKEVNTIKPFFGEPKLGVSFSIKYCSELQVDWQDCLQAILGDLKVRRLRLMSYWDQHQPSQNSYDFTVLDKQFELARQHGARISLCIGYRQPRWPESHQPGWAAKLSKNDWQQSLINYMEKTVLRYRGHPALDSWQLENEALNNFGEGGEYDRRRLRAEFDMVQRLDPTRPIIMSTSNSWGLPIRSPRPDMVGFSIYRHQFNHGKLRRSYLPPRFYRLRALLIRLIINRPSFIHELQAEPWGAKATNMMSVSEMLKLMDKSKLKGMLELADKTGLWPCYLWGAEWWYYMRIHHNKKELWQTAGSIFRKGRT